MQTVYKSNSQKIRVFSENWFLQNGYCVNCEEKIFKFKNNSPVADFYCSVCKNEFELKAKNGKIGKKINDGAYHTMIKRINSQNNPHLLVMSYDSEFKINDLIAIPSYFFTESIIEKRKELSKTAKRAGWIGCNILFSEIPEIGKVFLIKNQQIVLHKDVLNNWKNTIKFKTVDLEKRGWLFEILKIVEKQKNIFTLKDVYLFEGFLKIKFPKNNFIKEKIRQQLQILRDKKIIEFTTKGNYQKI